MDAQKFNKSIYIIIILALLEIMEHVKLIIFPLFIWSYNIAFLFLVMVFTTVYFFQLIYNFKNYLGIDNIKNHVTIMIIASWIFVVLFQLLIILIKSHKLHQLTHNIKIEISILMLTTLIALIISIIESIRFSGKLINKVNPIEVKRLGYSFYLLLIATIGYFILYKSKTLRPFSHVFLFFELLPYWFTYKIYQKLMDEKNNAINEKEN